MRFRSFADSPNVITPNLRAGAGHVMLGILAGCAVACSAGGNENQGLLPAQPGTSAGGSGPSIGGSTGNPDPAPGAGETPGFDLGDDVGDGVVAPGCQQAERKFDPKIPTVFMLVDRSGTMFDALPGTNNVSAWTALRSGALEVMRELESSVRFGFGAFVGKPLNQACDLDLPVVAPSLENYAAIASAYELMERPEDVEFDETPTALAIAGAAEQLRAAPGDGDKYILFVTDGEPDYCDNGNPRCPPDSVVALLQRLSAPTDAAGLPQAPIHLLVFGITSPNASVRLSVLQAFANAGAGLPVAPLVVNPGEVYDPARMYYECQGVPGWLADLTAAGKTAEPGATIATYVTEPALAGTAPVFQPDPTDQAALTDEIRAALAGVKSCTFDLAEDGVKVDLRREDLGERARVIVNGSPVALDPTNGWHMLTETTVQLEGTTCSAWRNPTIETTISFDFPCEIFVPQ